MKLFGGNHAGSAPWRAASLLLVVAWLLTGWTWIPSFHLDDGPPLTSERPLSRTAIAAQRPAVLASEARPCRPAIGKAHVPDHPACTVAGFANLHPHWSHARSTGAPASRQGVRWVLSRARGPPEALLG
jgi:hypothetical protein